jgi:PAS domain S-box-containing protein
VQVTAHHKNGEKFRVELTFIPVPMSHSLEFNGFLESLESDRPTESVLRRVNSQYSDVLDWIGSVVTDGVPLHRDELTAGTIVAFRPLEEIPWLEQAGGAPAAPGKSQPALVDAVDKAAEVLARSDALERTLDEAGEAVEEARAIADAAHDQAGAAAHRLSEMDQENETLRAELDELRTRLDSGGVPASSDELAGLRAEIAAIRELPPAVTREDLEAVRDELRELRHAEAGGETAGAAAERAEAAVQAVQALAEELRGEVTGAREAADAAAVEAKVARVQAEAARVHSEEAGGHAQSARELAEAWATAAEKHGRVASENGDSSKAERPRKPTKTEAPVREPRAGFDDVPEPMATIGLNGRFKELNPKFSELVGYREEHFHTASWPPVADRGKLDEHREQMRALIAGETDSVEVNTGYVHAQGLLVPVIGSLAVERDEDGEPSHFVLHLQAPAAAPAA